MPYDWSTLLFVQRWRQQVVRGHLVGAFRLGDQTQLHLRVQAPEWSSQSPATFADLQLLDVGDVVREKRLALLDRVSAVVQVLTAELGKSERRERSFALYPLSRAMRLPNARRVLRVDSLVTGEVVEGDGERSVLVDVGFSLVVTLLDRASPAPALADVKSGDWVELVVPTPPRGYVVVG